MLFSEFVVEKYGCGEYCTDEDGERALGDLNDVVHRDTRVREHARIHFDAPHCFDAFSKGGVHGG